MLSILRKLRAILSTRAKLQLLALIVLQILSAIVDTAGIASIMPFMALVISPDMIDTNRWLSMLYERLGMQSRESFLTTIGIAALVLLSITNLTKMMMIWLVGRFQFGRWRELGTQLLASYMARPYSFFLMRNSAELGNLIVGETRSLVDRVLRPIIDIVSNATLCITIVTLLLLINPIAAIAVATLIGGLYVLVYTLAHRRLAVGGEERLAAGNEVYRFAHEAMGGIKDLKLLGRESVYLDRFKGSARRLVGNDALVASINQMPRYVLEILAFGGIILTVIHFLNQGRRAEHIIPILALYAFAGYRLLPTLNMIYSSAVTLRYGLPSLDAVYNDIVAGPSASRGDEQSLRAKMEARSATFSSSLELRNVVFQYEGAPEPSLNGLSLNIRPNTSIGLVGPTGCGKTTTVDIILGLLEPGSGSVLIDGATVDAANVANWQKLIGYIPQTIYLADDTVVRNIAFGVPDEEIDMQAVRRAATAANLAEFIENDMPNGYDTELGERGVRLSGGQRQRIGIARALYRDPAVLVMDEATSALDGITEESVMRTMHEMSGRKTMIVIAHRLTTVRDCDVIYQLDRGTIAASGTYDELMQGSSWFRNAAQGMS
jgi:ABC-type multidrug transport system fused ATPase/permease subunit